MKARKYTRYPTSTPISLCINNMMGTHQLFLKDASQGGLCLNAHGCIDQGTPLNVFIPDDTLYGLNNSGASANTSARATVAWCQPVEVGQCQLGIQFEKLVKLSTIEKMVLKH